MVLLLRLQVERAQIFLQFTQLEHLLIDNCLLNLELLIEFSVIILGQIQLFLSLLQLFHIISSLRLYLELLIFHQFLNLLDLFFASKQLLFLLSFFGLAPFVFRRDLLLLFVKILVFFVELFKFYGFFGLQLLPFLLTLLELTLNFLQFLLTLDLVFIQLILLDHQVFDGGVFFYKNLALHIKPKHVDRPDLHFELFTPQESLQNLCFLV